MASRPKVFRLFKESCAGCLTACRALLAALTLGTLLASFAWSQVTEKVLYNFQGGTDGSNPIAGLIEDAKGNLYGTTETGGPSGYGTVFMLTPANGGWTETILHTFSGSDGIDPLAGLIFDSAGNLYGTAEAGGPTGDGTVFELTPFNGGWTVTILHTFNGTNGGGPFAGLIFDNAGNLYGTTVGGGANGYGTVFELTPSNGGWTENVLHSFSGSDGSYPAGGLIFDSVGNVYGTTELGGANGYGTVFQLIPSNSGWTETILHSFTGTDGLYPTAGLIFDSRGNLYGTTNQNGVIDGGTIFELMPSRGGWTETVLSSGGGYNNAALILDSAGNLYGTNVPGPGIGGFGTVFELAPSNGGWTETVLHVFGLLDGSVPYGGLILDSTGNLLGTTYYGGSADYGVVFEITGVSSGAPAVELTPAYLVFPNAGSTLPITVTNSGTANLDITVPQTLGGFDGFDFSVATGTTCTNGATVAPGASCVINVTFSPLTKNAAESATLSLFDNAPGSPQTVPLSGGATLASILPNPVTGSAGAQTITVTGSGFASGQVLNYKDLANPSTSGTADLISVTPNVLTASLPFTNATDMWELQVADPGAPACGKQGAPTCYYFEEIGTQYPYVNDYPFQNAVPDEVVKHQFPLRECTSFVGWRMNRNAGTTNPNYPFFFNAMGGGSWGNAENWNANASSLHYLVDKNPQVGAIAQWVANDACCGPTGHVAYVEQVNMKSGSVSSIVVSEYNYGMDDSGQKYQFGVRLIQKTAHNYPDNFIHVLYVSLSANLLNFGNQATGTSSSQSVTLTNPGTTAVPITSIIVGGANKSDFAETNTCGSSIPAGGSCQLTVTFTPQKAQPYSAIVTVSDVAGPPITQTITLTGSGA